MFSGDKQTRQSSGGTKSFFSRSKKDKDVPPLPDNASAHSAAYPSSTGSSRHSHRDSTSTIDQEEYARAGNEGLNMQAGVITSIPYDHMPDNNRQPLKGDGGLERRPTREPLPHHLNKGGSDFHQYPAWEGSSVPPRPPTHGSTQRPATARTFDSDSTTLNGYAASRQSSDQASILSTESHERRLQTFTSSIQASFSGQMPSSDAYMLGVPQPPPKDRAHSGLLNAHNPSAFSSTISFTGPNTFNPDGFSLSRPTDDRIIEKEFMDLMEKRGWKSLPEQAKRQMAAYPIHKKWTLVHQDRLAEWQGEQKRRTAIHRSTVTSQEGFSVLGRSDEEGSPEWYVKKILDNTITPKQLQSLAVSLRTQPIAWVKAFVEAQGQVALTNALAKINRRQNTGSASNGSLNERDLDKEYDIVKCLKALMNNKYGADDALRHDTIVTALAGSLTSLRLTTRKLTSELLTFLSHWADGQGHAKVLQALDHLKAQQGETSRFDAWLRIVEVTVDGRGKMGSMVGASEEVRSGGIGMENLLMEYAVTTMFLINSLVDAAERDLTMRVHIRANLVASGARRIMTKMEDFQYEVIDKQIEHYRTNEAIDYEDLLEREGGSIADADGEPKDLNDPTQIVQVIQQRLAGTKESDYFASTMQHLLLMKDNTGDEREKMFQLVNSMLSYVAMDRRLPDMDLKQSLNFTVQNLVDKLYTDSEARQAREEAHQARLIADAAVAERDEVQARLDLGAEGLVAKLRKQVEEQAAIIDMQSRSQEGLKSELAELQRVRAQELQRNELETRELYLMLRDAQDIAAVSAKKAGKPGATDPVQLQGIMDRERLMERLEKQLERAKTQAKLEGKSWQQFNPSDKLRELREKMEGAGMDSTGMEGQIQYLGSARRGKSAIARKPVNARKSSESDGDVDLSEDDVVFETPQLIEMTRPKVPSNLAAQQQGMLSELTKKTQRLDASDDEDEGITTGPSHPSLESESPKTPGDEAPAQDKFTSPAAPPPPPMAGFDGAAPPPPPPMPGFTNGAPPPPPPPMPGFSNNAPPPPPMPGFSGSMPPPPPPMPGFDGAAPPPPPPPPGFGGAAPNAPPLPHPQAGSFLSKPMYNAQPTHSPIAPRPKKKLKALHWEKVDAPEITMWAGHTPTTEAKEEKYQELSKKGILDEIERLFLAKDIKVLGKKSSKAKDDKKQVISRDLMHTMQIALAKFSQMDAETIVRMIIHCDREILDNSTVMDFLGNEHLCTIPDNVAKLMAPYSKDWTGPDALKSDREQDPSELTKEDQIYLYTAYELHHYWKARQRALTLTRQYESDYDEISGRIKQVVDVSEGLRNSVRLMPVFGLILDIGNYMNDSNKQAHGFKLSSLARLGMVKDTNNESTLMDYVERVVRHQYPQYEGFADDIGGVITAQKINIEQLQADAKKYVDNINNVQMSLDSGNLSDPKRFHPEDRVSQVVQRSMKEARRKAEQMQLYLDEMNRVFDDILTFFGDDNKDETARRDFFGKLANFVQEYKKSYEKNVVLEETWARNEANMRRKQVKASALATATGEGMPASPASTGAMDALFEKLRAAAPATKDTRERRRRARLESRHKIRVASGQKIPETGENVDAEELASPVDDAADKDTADKDENIGEEKDVADQAASMLQFLRGDDGEASELRVARRRESATDERQRRRARRRAPGTSTSIDAPNITITEEVGEEEKAQEDEEAKVEGGESSLPSPPVTIVVQPSPTPEMDESATNEGAEAKEQDTAGS